MVAPEFVFVSNLLLHPSISTVNIGHTNRSSTFTGHDDFLKCSVDVILLFIETKIYLLLLHFAIRYDSTIVDCCIDEKMKR